MASLRSRMKRLRSAAILIPRFDSVIALVNDLRRLVAGSNPHLTDDTTLCTSPNATDQASAQVLINDLKAKYNTHRASGTFHAAADATNTLATADMSDAASGYTLMTAAKVAFNAHIILMSSHVDKQDSYKLLLGTPATVQALIAAVNEWKVSYNRHMAFTNIVVAAPTLDVA